MMATAILYYIQNSIWPFTAFFKFDDLKASEKLVEQLPVPKHTKDFIFAIREPESQAIIYILCVQNLSERSAHDADSLIRAVKPDAVVVQVSNNFDDEKDIESENGGYEPVPTSWFGVLKRCFVRKTNKDEYENVAGSLVMREIFGIGLHGHFMAAKRGAEEVGSSFLLLESSFKKYNNCSGVGTEVPVNNINEWVSKKFGAFACQPSNLVSQKVVSSFIPNTSLRSGLFCLNDRNLQAVRSFSTYITQSISPISNGDEKQQLFPRADYEAPAFAQPIYSLLLDLHYIFADIPSMGSALAHAQRMLNDVSKGKTVDSKLISEVYAFQIAVEGLRIALNNAGRVPINSINNKPFPELDAEEKSHALVAQALKSQAKEFKSIVAVMDVSSLAGLRKYWYTCVPDEVKGALEELITNCDENNQNLSYNDKKRLLTSKPVIAAGAGATAILGASSISKAVPLSTLMKVITYKAPLSLKLLLSQTQKAFAIMSKGLGTSKIMSPGFKAAASTEKIKVVAHSVIASAEKTSFSAMRTAFYEIMRKRRVRPIGFLPWATFGGSITTCSCLLMYGDGIECVAESLPAAPSIASLGRGIQSLQVASQSVRQVESFRIKKSIDALMYRFKNNTKNAK